ncbi:PREDICTED: chitooligosaccharidolytic beta-N-acetylglucosaminidase [Nicrophorus vespilloides]|uniref:Beta-hexosaminidase n=1 Tax=Nicrophorus vespilloides TaxID=110193 RepID=A0ABM1N0K6_NICVS|nr:PREDICTED: chitooligosaccharidolytic beta-N-acetylglucosaminidase [Nicrophorus vespilloides]
MMQPIWLLLLLIGLFHLSHQATNTWVWRCNQEVCVRQHSNKNSIQTNVFRSIEECRLVCGADGSIWPLPSVKFNKSSKLLDINPNEITFELVGSDPVKEILEENVKIFKKNILSECRGACGSDGEALNIKVIVNSTDVSLNWETDESYELKSNNLFWKINAATVFGARHGLESLSQLIAAYNAQDKIGLVTVANVHIVDKPFYKHRSLMIDTGRNFLTVETIKRQIDAMASSKLNILHWHITDSQSFPYVSVRVPNLSRFGSFSENQVYNPQDIKELRDYAKIRGIRILMEIDAPSHAGNGWQWGPHKALGNLSVCVNKQPWRYNCIQPPCGQLNPANIQVYNVLNALYKDIVEQFPESEFFHMGGDEVYFPCWNSTPEIVNYMKQQGKGQNKGDLLDLWGEFQENALAAYDSAVGNSDTKILLWSSELTNPEAIEKYLDKNRYIIETWVPSYDPLPQSLLEKGYKLVISTKNAWYLDHGFWGNTKYYTWRNVYENRLINHRNVIGGEVCMWGELVNGDAIDSRVWPRAAAAAERLWSNSYATTKQVEARMYRHRERLISRGIAAEALTPFWCYQNEGQCL